MHAFGGDLVRQFRATIVVPFPALDSCTSIVAAVCLRGLHWRCSREWRAGSAGGGALLMQTSVNIIVCTRQKAPNLLYVVLHFYITMQVKRIVLPYPFRWNKLAQCYEWERPADNPLAGPVIGALRSSVLRLS